MSYIYYVDCTVNDEIIITAKPYSKIHIGARALKFAIDIFNNADFQPRRYIAKTCSANGYVTEFPSPIVQDNQDEEVSS